VERWRGLIDYGPPKLPAVSADDEAPNRARMTRKIVPDRCSRARRPSWREMSVREGRIVDRRAAAAADQRHRCHSWLLATGWGQRWGETKLEP